MDTPANPIKALSPAERKTLAAALAKPLSTAPPVNPPHIYSCAEWGARRVAVTSNIHKAKGIVIHHTADPNRTPLEGEAEKAAAFSLARRIQLYHMDHNGWRDSGQHFTISRGGVVMEGRHGSLLGAVHGEVPRGAHAHSNLINETMFGIENEGNNTDACHVTETHFAALVELCAWLAYWGDFDTQEIHPHREYRGTICPGHLADRLPELRDKAHTRKLEIIAAHGAIK